VMTGAAMWDSEKSVYVEPRLIEQALVSKAVKVFREEGLEPFMYCIDGSFLNVYHHGALSPQEQTFVDARTGLRLKKFHLDATPERIVEAENVILIFGMGEYEHLSRVADILNADGEYSVSFYEDNASTQYYIEVFAAGVSKAEAVMRLAAMTGATQITVYGDNLNDISMMEAATDSVAVANAKPEVLAAASRTIAANIDDAVAVDVDANTKQL
ncbi:MAG: HAD family hydrolase, partial [Duncaniella sp.]|nr:HAD family hydrolase [Duncaniella sp.]